MNMANVNINLDTLSLDSLIQTLESDNLELDNLIKSTNNAIRKLDDTRWKSSEKEKFMNQVLPFLDKIEKNFYSSLNECTNLLKEANIKYQETNTNIKNTVDEVDGSISIDIL